MSHPNGARAILFEAIQDHKAYAADRPWMQKPTPICVDVADLEAILSERDAERERCAMQCEAHAGIPNTGAWVALIAAAHRIREDVEWPE